MNLLAIFLTGLTTGGLTCLAVQGGLLATALPRQVVIPAAKQSRKGQPSTATLTSIQLPKNPLPVVYFMAAKLIAYTILGFLLGTLGAAVQVTPTIQAVMQMIAGLFMVATALNMLNVHPIFRFAVIQPPKALTRLIRNQAKSQEMFTPALLGLMTVLIPCGTTQAMEVLAISSGSPILGTLIMFAFVLGTSPTFLVLGFLATRLRGKFQNLFAATAALLILFLGVISLDGALNLLGSPLTPSRLIAAVLRSDKFTPSGALTAAQVVDGIQEITLTVEYSGYSPDYINAQSGQPIRLRLVTNESYGCARAFTIPSLGINEILPETGETVIDLPAQPRGMLQFTCSMGMYSGVINIS
jgi:uncharacterized protein